MVDMSYIISFPVIFDQSTTYACILYVPTIVTHFQNHLTTEDKKGSTFLVRFYQIPILQFSCFLRF
jgi:hypothetical protein